MALLEWSESFSVGVATFDEEHRNLVQLMNDLYQHILDGTATRGSAHQTLDKLVTYIHEHFRHEEDVLQAHSYPGLEEHKRKHQRLREQIGNFQAAGKNADGLSLEVSRFLLNWVLQHVLKEDMRYREYLLARGVR